MDSDRTYDVLVVGGGPAGAAAAYGLASHGHDVLVVERKSYPRDKTCGDALTPRAVHALHDMGLGPQLASFHRYTGLRTLAHGRHIALTWPEHRDYPDHGYVIKRHDIDKLVIDHAAAAGVTVRDGTEAISAIIERGFVRGAVLRDTAADTTANVRARYVVVADGANSRFGRSLGTTRAKGWPYGTAIRGYWESPMHNEPWIESTLGVKDRDGNPLPGYGWVFPLGDGTVNVGVGLLSTYRDFKSVNTTQLLGEFVASASERWGLTPDTPTDEPRAARLPMGGSVSPKSGPTFLVVGDAAGTVNPFSGEGIAYAYETGRIAANVLHEALSTHDPRALTQYVRQLDDAYGLYFKVARLFARIVGRPVVLRELSWVVIHSRTLMEWLVRIMSNSLQPDDAGGAEAAYRAMSRIARLIPDP
jgi:menaquinone-9 beta-reductase